MSLTGKLIKSISLSAATLLVFSCAQHKNRAADYPDNPWPFYHGGIVHHGYADVDAKPSLKRMWIVQLEEGGNPQAPQEYASPVASGGTVYFGSIRGSGIRALSHNNGRELWRFSVEKGVESSPALYENKLYFGGNDGLIYALKADSGELVWSFDTGAEVLSSPIAEGGILYIAASNDILYALDAVTGKVIWRYKKGGAGSGIFSIRGASSPAYMDGVVYIGFTDGSVTAVGAFDGSLIWERKLTDRKNQRFYDVDSSPVIDGGRLYIASYASGLFALDAGTGNEVWKYGTGAASTPAVDSDSLYFSDKEGKVVALDKRSGEAIWEYKLKEGIATAPIAIDDTIVFGSSHKKLYLLDKTKGEIIDTYRTSKGFSASPIFYKGYVYTISNAGYAYCFGR